MRTHATARCQAPTLLHIERGAHWRRAMRDRQCTIPSQACPGKRPIRPHHSAQRYHGHGAAMLEQQAVTNEWTSGRTRPTSLFSLSLPPRLTFSSLSNTRSEKSDHQGKHSMSGPFQTPRSSTRGPQAGGASQARAGRRGDTAMARPMRLSCLRLARA